MIWIDYVIIGLISIGLIKGMLRGFSLELYSLLLWILATGVGLILSRGFSVFLEASINDSVPKIAASFALLFLLTLIVGVVIRMILGESIKTDNLTFSDYLGGMIFGIAHGMLLVVILVMLAGLTALPDDLWWKDSKLLPPYQTGAIWLRDHIPSGLAEYIHYR
ncbi:MAG: CvpA family protein [Methylococcales bacterium]|nr:CvpA family protein [Methylococcales bacterium]MDD5631090.1 CvpA family protein [Methylococcales bacterium]